MSIEDERRRVRAELEAEFQRLDTVYEVLADMQDAAITVSRSKHWAEAGFEASRIEHVGVLRQVHTERSAVWDRLLDHKYTPEQAAQIRARRDEATRKAEHAAEQHRPGRSR